jgi:hypothetical protein
MCSEDVKTITIEKIFHWWKMLAWFRSFVNFSNTWVIGGGVGLISPQLVKEYIVVYQSFLFIAIFILYRSASSPQNTLHSNGNTYLMSKRIIYFIQQCLTMIHVSVWTTILRHKYIWLKKQVKCSQICWNMRDFVNFTITVTLEYYLFIYLFCY